tara:strand:- start:393 stop:620 length:228 start_codon:yes stop_codon:yes gene_type:complete
MSENITDFERAALREGRQISDADRALAHARVAKAKAKRAKEISEGTYIYDADRAERMKEYINSNDGGIAKKTRTF